MILDRCEEITDMKFTDDRSGFVNIRDIIPEVITEIRYYTSFNFVGKRICGYEEPAALLTREAAYALKEVSDEVYAKGYRLKIYDAYRPQQAVDHFVRWAEDPEDTRMKDIFYPDTEKREIIPLGYVSKHSGHSRGSTVDLTLTDRMSGEDIDMGGIFDYFGERSHYAYAGLSEIQKRNRKLLRDVMERHGFVPLAEEWWHFTLAQEPYPDTFFTFPVRNYEPVH